MDEDIDQKIELVDKNIGEFARDLAGNNKDLEERLKIEIREIILQSDLKNSGEETVTLIKTLTGENTEADTETIVKAKEAGLGLSRWTVENIGAVRVYRGEDLKTKLVEETKKNNLNITEEQIDPVRRLADNINRVYNSNGGVENQKDVVLEEYKNESIGKLKNEWNDLQGIGGLLKQTPEQFEKIIKNDEEITADLQKHEIKIPYQKFDKVASYDRVMNSIKNPEMRRFIESARNRFKTLDRISNGRFSQVANNFVSRIGGDRLRNIANNFFNKSIVKVTNGFASKIGNQAAKSFVQNSMGTLLKNGVSNGMKSILQGAMKKGAQLAGKAAMNVATKMGLKAAALGLKAAFGAATAGLGYVVMAGWEALKLGGKLIGKIIEAFGLELTNNKMADTIIFIAIGLFVLLGGLGIMTANNVSSLVPEVETEEGGGGGGPFNHGEITTLEDGRIKSCGVGMEVDFKRKAHKTWVTPDLLAGGNYNKQLEEFVGDQLGTPCGVVYAAQYLAYDFDYWVSYWLTGKYAIKGLNPEWGNHTVSDWNGHREGPLGLDCGAFRNWAWVNGGYFAAMGNAIPNVPFGDCDKIKSIIEPGDGLYMEKPPEVNGKKTYSHSAIVLAYDGQNIKFAHAGGGSGVTTGLINICTGVGVDNGNHFDFLQKKNY